MNEIGKNKCVVGDARKIHLLKFEKWNHEFVYKTNKNVPFFSLL